MGIFLISIYTNIIILIIIFLKKVYFLIFSI